MPPIEVPTQCHVIHVLRIAIVLGPGQPVAAAAAGDADADHAQLALQRFGQGIKVAAVACQAMHADQHARMIRIAPVGVVQAVKAGAVQARQFAVSHGVL